LVKLREGRFVPFIDKLPRVQSILEARDHSLWLSTVRELYHWKAGQRTKYGDFGDYYSSAYEDAEGTIWAASMMGGLVRIKNGFFTRFKEPAEIFGFPLYHVFEDRSGNLWITSAHGVIRVKKQDLSDYAEGRARTVFGAVFDESDGMPSRNCDGAVQNAGYQTPDGRSWIPTNAGITVLDPERVPASTPPHTVVEEVWVDHRPVDPLHRAKLPPDARTFEFRYSGIDLSDGDHVQYRYRLEGFDRDWVNAGTRTVANYTNLGAGAYQFEVQSRSRQPQWNGAATAFVFEVESHFYRTWWFFSLALTFLAALAVAAHRLRIHDMQARLSAASDARIGERTRIAREIHDTLLQGLTGASLLLEAVGPHMREPGLKEKVDHVLDQIEHSMAETRQAVWNLYNDDDQLRDLPKALQTEGQQLTSAAGIRFEFVSQGDLAGSPARINRELVRIAQEALINAIRHSGASTIRMMVAGGEGTVQLVVEDNGRGFDVNRVSEGHGHWGLAGMRERVRQLGGELTICNAPGNGTMVRAAIPLP
jgi:signal transduction histidine kinase